MEKIFKPIISVIVPVYKVEKYLRNCLNSILNQTFQDWEALLVDDGSPDGSGEICDEYARMDNRFKVVHKKNGGLSSARNTAIPLAKGEYIFFLDSDDFIHENALDTLLVLAENHDADIVQCGYIRGKETKFPENKIKTIEELYTRETIFTKFAYTIITWDKLYRKKIIGDIRFPEGRINEDDYTTWKFYDKAQKILITNMPLYYYTVNPNSIMANQTRKPDFSYFSAYRERFEYHKEHNEPKLEGVSRIHWMKSLVLVNTNKNISSKDRSMIRRLFLENYKITKSLPIKIPLKLDFLFRLFIISPKLSNMMLRKLR